MLYVDDLAANARRFLVASQVSPRVRVRVRARMLFCNHEAAHVRHCGEHVSACILEAIPLRLRLRKSARHPIFTNNAQAQRVTQGKAAHYVLSLDRHNVLRNSESWVASLRYLRIILSIVPNQEFLLRPWLSYQLVLGLPAFGSPHIIVHALSTHLHAPWLSWLFSCLRSATQRARLDEYPLHANAHRRSNFVGTHFQGFDLQGTEALEDLAQQTSSLPEIVGVAYVCATCAWVCVYKAVGLSMPKRARASGHELSMHATGFAHIKCTIGRVRVVENPRTWPHTCVLVPFPPGPCDSGPQETNILGIKGPRKMTTVIPAMTSDGHRITVHRRQVCYAVVIDSTGIVVADKCEMSRLEPCVGHGEVFHLCITKGALHTRLASS